MGEERGGRRKQRKGRRGGGKGREEELRCGGCGRFWSRRSSRFSGRFAAVAEEEEEASGRTSAGVSLSASVDQAFKCKFAIQSNKHNCDNLRNLEYRNRTLSL
jgi:hypothetical protein